MKVKDLIRKLSNLNDIQDYNVRIVQNDLVVFTGNCEVAIFDETETVIINFDESQ